MGLTIHYSLESKARSLKKVRELVAGLRSRAMDLPFAEVSDVMELTGEACDFNQCEDDDPNRWLLIQAGQYVTDPLDERFSYSVSPTHVIAFKAWPGEGCEPANCGLCRYPAKIGVGSHDRKIIRTRLSGWSWTSFCKTQYASDPGCGGVQNFLRCHLTVVALLDHAKSLGILGDVDDEGEFWERRNIESLAREVGEWNEAIAALAGRLKDALGGGMELAAAITEFSNFEHLEARGRN